MCSRPTVALAVLGGLLSISTGSLGAVPCADCNGDGMVNLADLNGVLFAIGGPGACDFNGNGIVDWDDLRLVISQLNQSCPPTLPDPPFTTFEIFDVDLGGGLGLLGAPVTTTLGGAIYQRPSGTSYPPTSAAVSADPLLEFDSYVALGGRPTTTMEQALTPVQSTPNAAAHFAAPGALGARWGNNASIFTPSKFLLTPAGVSRLSRNQVVFVGRLTIADENLLAGQRVHVFVKDALGYHFLDLPLGGPQVSIDSFGMATAVPFRARAYWTFSVNIPGFGPARACDLFVEGGPHNDGVYGDDDGDCFVSFVDLNNVLSFFGMSGPSLPGDIDDDGHVLFNDLNIVLSNFTVRCADQ